MAQGVLSFESNELNKIIEQYGSLIRFYRNYGVYKVKDGRVKMFQNQKDADRYMKHIHNNSENFEYYNGAFFTCKGKNGKTTNRLDDDKANGFYYIGKTDRKLHFCSVKEIKNNFPDDFIRENVYSKNSSYYFSIQLSIILEACGFKNNNDLI